MFGLFSSNSYRMERQKALKTFLQSSFVAYGSNLYCRLAEFKQAVVLYAHLNRLRSPQLQISFLTTAFKGLSHGLVVKKERHNNCVTNWIHGLRVTLPSLPSEPSEGSPGDQYISDHDDDDSDDDDHENLVDYDEDLPLRESQVRDQLVLQVGGQIEVAVPIGRIDILTPHSVIEVKKGRHWMHGIGQLQAYGQYFPDRKKILQLFGNLPVQSNIDVIRTTCASVGIEVWLWPANMTCRSCQKVLAAI